MSIDHNLALFCGVVRDRGFTDNTVEIAVCLPRNRKFIAADLGLFDLIDYLCNPCGAPKTFLLPNFRLRFRMSFSLDVVLISGLESTMFPNKNTLVRFTI